MGDELVTIKNSKKGMRDFLDVYFREMFGAKGIDKKRIIFNTPEDAKHAYNDSIKTEIMYWGYEFELKDNYIYYSLTEQTHTFIDELKRDPNYIENRKKYYEQSYKNNKII